MSHESTVRFKPEGCPPGFPETTYFLDPMVSIADMEIFFYLASEGKPTGKTRVSTNNVITTDGILSLADFRYADSRVGLSGAGINGLHLMGIRPNLEGAVADARLLQYGWTQCATVASSTVLRAEPDLLWRPWDPDLRDLFDKTYATKPAVRVVVSRNAFSKEELGRFPLFNQEDDSNIVAVIATTDSGKAKIIGEMNKMEKKPKVIVESFGQTGVDVVKLVEYLGDRFKFDEIDWQGGGQLTGEAIKAGIVDIFRITYSPIIAGSLNFEGKLRATAVHTFLDITELTSMQHIKSAFCYSHQLKIFSNMIYK